jgi:hypothetical protein
MKLKTLLLLQLAYAVMGVGYNVLSYLSVASGGQAFSATAPLTGGLSLTLYALCLVPGFAGTPHLSRVMLLSIVVSATGVRKAPCSIPGARHVFVPEATVRPSASTSSDWRSTCSRGGKVREGAGRSAG